MAVGCGDDSGDAEMDSGAGAAPEELSFDDAVRPGESRLGELDLEAPAFEYEDIEAPWETVDECYAFGDDSNRTCLCDACTELMRECDALEGCTEIRACSLATGCTGPNECYLLPGAPCTRVIDRWSNSSVSTAVSLDIMECTTAEGC